MAVTDLPVDRVPACRAARQLPHRPAGTDPDTVVDRLVGVRARLDAERERLRSYLKGVGDA